MTDWARLAVARSHSATETLLWETLKAFTDKDGGKGAKNVKSQNNSQNAPNIADVLYVRRINGMFSLIHADDLSLCVCWNSYHYFSAI